MSTRIDRSLIGLALLTASTVACSSDGDDKGSTTAMSESTDAANGTDAPAETDAPDDPAAAGGEEFVIESFAFPERFVATAGEAITVTNADGSPHTVTSPDFSVRVDAGDSAELTVPEAGEYSIICEIHTQMTGTLTVE